VPDSAPDRPHQPGGVHDQLAALLLQFRRHR
jgi:hypothetical protein